MNRDQWILLVKNESFSPTLKEFKSILTDWAQESEFLKKRLEVIIQLNKVYSLFLKTVEDENRALKKNL